jgi:hypothetical protein
MEMGPATACCSGRLRCLPARTSTETITWRSRRPSACARSTSSAGTQNASVSRAVNTSGGSGGCAARGGGPSGLRALAPSALPPPPPPSLLAFSTRMGRAAAAGAAGLSPAGLSPVAGLVAAAAAAGGASALAGCAASGLGPPATASGLGPLPLPPMLVLAGVER